METNLVDKSRGTWNITYSSLNLGVEVICLKFALNLDEMGDKKWEQVCLLKTKAGFRPVSTSWIRPVLSGDFQSFMNPVNRHLVGEALVVNSLTGITNWNWTRGLQWRGHNSRCGLTSITGSPKKRVRGEDKPLVEQWDDPKCVKITQTKTTNKHLKWKHHTYKYATTNHTTTKSEWTQPHLWLEVTTTCTPRN